MTRPEVADLVVAQARRHGCITREAGELIRRYRVPSSMFAERAATAVQLWHLDRADRLRAEDPPIVSDAGALLDLERCGGCGVALALCRRGDVYAHSDLACYWSGFATVSP